MIKHFSGVFSRSFYSSVLFFTLLITLGACRNDPAEIKMLTEPGSFSVDKAFGITGIYSKNGVVKTRLYAKEYIKDASALNPYTDLNKNIKVEFYSDSGLLQSTLTADSLRYYEGQGNAIVWGNVKIVTTKGEELRTDELIWSRNNQKIFTEKQVKITTGTEVLMGNGMEANQDFTWYQILNTKGSVAVNKGEVPKD